MHCYVDHPFLSNPIDPPQAQIPTAAATLSFFVQVFFFLLHTLWNNLSQTLFIVSVINFGLLIKHTGYTNF